MRELEIFRKAYPQYDNVDDQALVKALAEKYPKAYGKLPSKLEFEEKSIRENPNLYGAYGATKALASEAIKPTLQATGAVVGSASGPIVGSALGYGIGTKAGEMVERGVSKVGEYLGFESPQQAKGVVDELISSGKDVGFALAFGKGFELAGKGAQMAETFLFDKLPQKLMASSVKMPLTKRWTKVLPGEEITRRQAASTEALKSEVTPSEYGAQKIRSLEKEVRTYIDDFLDVKATDPKAVLNRDELINDGLKKAYADAERSSDPVGAKAIVDDIAAKFKAHPEKIPVNEANKIKQQLYRETSWTGNEKTGVAGQLTETGKKGISHEIMVRLEKAYPELSELNATDSARIGLRDAIEKEIALQSQKNLVGLASKVLLRPWMWPIAIWDATMGHPAVKSRLAIALAKANPSKYGKFEYPEMGEAYKVPNAPESQPTGWIPPESQPLKASMPSKLKTELQPGEPAWQGQTVQERQAYQAQARRERRIAEYRKEWEHQRELERMKRLEGRSELTKENVGIIKAEIPGLSKGLNKVVKEEPELSEMIRTTPKIGGHGQSADSFRRLYEINQFLKSKGKPQLKATDIKALDRLWKKGSADKIREFLRSKGREPNF